MWRRRPLRQVSANKQMHATCRERTALVAEQETLEARVADERRDDNVGVSDLESDELERRQGGARAQEAGDAVSGHGVVHVTVEE